jgi:hypothetical protein
LGVVAFCSYFGFMQRRERYNNKFSIQMGALKIKRRVVNILYFAYAQKRTASTLVKRFAFERNGLSRLTPFSFAHSAHLHPQQFNGQDAKNAPVISIRSTATYSSAKRKLCYASRSNL